MFARSPCFLPGMAPPQSGILCIGRSGNLAGRNHLRMENSGFSSPRRSLGALLKSKLQLAAEPRSPGPSPKNCRNYRFGGQGETRLSNWMRRNLTYAVCPLNSDVQGMESQLIRECKPPLNLIGSPNPRKRMIERPRVDCVEEARIVRSARL